MRDLETIAKLRGELSIRAAASATGLSPTTIQTYWSVMSDNDDGTIDVHKRRGTDGKSRPSRRFDTAGRDLEIHRLARDGKTIAEIASTVGCSVGTAHRIAKTAPRHP